MDFKEIVITVLCIIFIPLILWKFFNSHPSDKYHNDSWKDERKKRK